VAAPLVVGAKVGLLEVYYEAQNPFMEW
jgi:hypothetical protein